MDEGLALTLPRFNELLSLRGTILLAPDLRLRISPQANERRLWPDGVSTAALPAGARLDREREKSRPSVV